MAFPSAGYEYEADAIADGLIHYYPMYQPGTPSNSITDYISGFNLYIGNNNPTNCFDGSTIVGDAVNLVANGISTAHNWIQSIPDTTDSTLYTSYTISFWVSHTNVAPTSTNVVYLNTTVDSGIRVYQDLADDYVKVSDTDSNIVASTFTPTSGVPFLVTVVVDITGPTTTLYINGASANSMAYALPLKPYQLSFYLGANTGTASDTSYVEGVVDEFSIFSRALTGTEVGYIYNSGSGIPLIKFLESREIVSSVIGFADSVAWNFDVSVSEQLGIGDNFLTALLILLADAADQTGIADATPDDPTIIFLPIVEDNLATADTFDVTSAMSAVASDGVNFVTAFNVSGESYIGVVMNTQNQAVTEYGNFDFNSMAYLGGNKYYGAKTDGIYELDGTDDAGSQIDALLSTHLMNFGSQEWKRVERAYLGIRNDGPMVLKTIVRDDATGERKEYWYELTETSEAARIERIKVGKGLKSHLWQFELHNNEGSDFDLDSLEFVPIVLSRRV